MFPLPCFRDQVNQPWSRARFSRRSRVIQPRAPLSPWVSQTSR